MMFFGTCYPLTYNSKQIGSIDHCYNYVKHLIIQESWYASFPCATKEISSVLFVYLTVIVLIMSRHIIHRSGLFIYVCFWSPAREKGTRGSFETLDTYKSTFWFLWNKTPRRKPDPKSYQGIGEIKPKFTCGHCTWNNYIDVCTTCREESTLIVPLTYTLA
jgi:hypothetical protein